jgi:hypothetical protein
MAADFELWSKILLHAKGLNLPEVLVLYRKGENDSNKFNHILNEESIMVRELIYLDTYANTPNQLKRALRNIATEKKEYKSFLDSLRIYIYLKKQLKGSLEKNSKDYKRIAFFLMMHLYACCIFFNKAFYSRILQLCYIGLKKIVFKNANHKHAQKPKE